MGTNNRRPNASDAWTTTSRPPTDRRADKPRIAREIELARFLRRHHGAIGTNELHDLGFSKDTIRRLVEREILLPQRRGAYRAGSAPPSDATLLRCCLLSVGGDAAIGRASAAFRLGLIDFAPRIETVVTARASARGRRDGLLVVHAPSLTESDIVTTDGIRGTHPRRTVLDLALGVRTNADFKLLRRAVRQGAVKDKRLAETITNTIEETGPFRGSRILASVLDEHRAGATWTRSELEEAFLDLCRDAGIPLPMTNVVVEGHELDMAWLDERVFVELDTYDYHGDVRSFERDRARDADLVVAGFRGIRVTGRRLDREPDKVVAQTRVLVTGSRRG